MTNIKKIINELIQLQELLEARAQQEAVKGNGRLVALDASIQAMLNDFEPELAARFRRLHKKWHTAVVPVVNGSCSGCGMTVPVSQAHEVRAALAIQHCPNCSRILFAPESAAPQGRQRKTVRNAKPLAGIARFSTAGLMVTSLAAKTGEEAIRELCEVLRAQEFVEDSNLWAEEALKREAIVTTALENGIAFPHIRGVEGCGLTLAFGTSPKGIRFSSDTRALTRMVFFVAIPTAASAFYLKLLAGLAQTFSNAENRDKALAAETPAELWKILVQTTRKTIL